MCVSLVHAVLLQFGWFEKVFWMIIDNTHLLPALHPRTGCGAVVK